MKASMVRVTCPDGNPAKTKVALEDGSGASMLLPCSSITLKIEADSMTLTIEVPRYYIRADVLTALKDLNVVIP